MQHYRDKCKPLQVENVLAIGETSRWDDTN